MSIVFLKNSLKCTNYVYKSIAVSADDNPHVLSGNIAHEIVALFWKRTIDDFVTPLENIESDCTVGIRCDFDNCDPLFDEFKECLDFLWALYDSLPDKGHVLVLDDFNGDLGDSLGDKKVFSKPMWFKTTRPCKLFQSLP